MERIAFENNKENRNLSQIAAQNQKDSRTLKTLTLIATMYLPASLIAVCLILQSPSRSAKCSRYFNSRQYLARAWFN